MANKTRNAQFDSSFIESYAGATIMTDPKVALMELIANAWDAGSTKVDITLPLENGDRFSITDNGHGMNDAQFADRYMKFGYRRTEGQGTFAEVPSDHTNIAVRPAFGRNAKGKFAAFLFGKQFGVRTWRDGKERTYEVFRSTSSALSYKPLGQNDRSGHGTEIFVDKARTYDLDANQARMEVGMRFLTDPNFEVSLNGEKVQFSDIPTEFIETQEFIVDKVGKVTITVIDSNTTDRTMHLHGIAWWVQGRLVGECSWTGSGYEHLFDGRRVPARRYTFIVQADGLKDLGAVLPDWKGFNPKIEEYQNVSQKVSEFVRDYVFKITEESRGERFEEIKSDNQSLLREMPLVSRGKWEHFVKEVQKECPSITDTDLDKMSNILATLETSVSKYGLLDQLSRLDAEGLNDLNTVLDKWNVDFAKIVLDELEARLKLLQRLKIRVKNTTTDEVQDLQPLFERGLWIFGPEYETIEYTANEGMTSVIQKIFGKAISGSRNRPDFAIVPDGSVGMYSYPRYDNESGGEIGVDNLTIVELKKPGVPIADKEKRQPMKYVKELDDAGHLLASSKVRCFVLGETVDKSYVGETTDQNGRIVTWALPYDTIIARAESRLHNLYKKLSQAPFLKETRLEEYLNERSQGKLAMP